MVTLTLEGGAAYRLESPSVAAVTIQNDDEAVPSAVSTPAQVTEGGAFELAVGLSNPGSSPITVHYQLAGTAVAGEDYRGAADGAVVFAPGEMEKTIRIETLDDSADEPEETIEVLLGRTDPPTLAAATLRILDDDLPVVTAAAAPAAVTEGEDAVFVLTRVGVVSEALEVAVAVTDAGAALTGAAPAGVTFAAGEATAALRLGTEDDEAAEASAAVVLALQPGAGWALGAPAEATVTVADDESAPSVSIADAGSVTEGGALAFPVSLSHSFDAPIAVGYTLGGTAAAGDYTDAADGAVTFAPGELRKAVSLATVDDSADEPDETIGVELVVFRPARAGPTTEATGRILDNDLPDITVAAEADTVTEGEDAVFVLTRAGDVSEALEVAVAVTDADGVVASTPLPTGVTFGAGDATAALRLATRDNATDELGDAEVVLTLQAGAGWDLEAPSAAAVTVEDDERPVVTAAADAATVLEGADVAFTLTRAGDVSEALDVFFTIEDADGVVTTTPLPTGVSFGAGSATATLRLDTETDTVVEPDAVVTLALEPGAGYEPGDPSQASVTVRENDGGLSRASVVAGDPDAVPEGGTITFVLRLTRANAEEVRVVYELFGTATAGADYRGADTGTAVFAPGETEKTVSRVTVNDGVDEEEETVRLDIAAVRPSTSTGPGLPFRATVRILDGLPLVTVAADAAAVTEGADAAFTLTRTGDTAEALTVPVEVADAGGVVTSTPLPTGVTFEAGAATAQVALATADDDVDAADAAVVLTLAPDDSADPAWAPGASAAATVTVEDDDLPVVTVAAEAELIVKGEDVAFIVARAGDLSETLAVDADFSVAGRPKKQPVTFAAGDATVRFVGPKSKNGLTYVLTLREGAGYRLGTPSEAAVVRDDSAVPEASVADADAVREGGTLAFPVSLSRPFNAELEVDYTLGGSATAGADYKMGSRTVTFAPRTTQATILLATVDDADDETAETVVVTLADGPTWNLGAASEAEGRILDNDGLPEVTVAADAEAVTEGEAAAFTLTRWGDVSAALEVFVAVTDPGAALAGAAPAGVTFEAGAATAMLVLATDDDTVDEPAAALTLALQPDAAWEPGEPSAAAVTVEDNDAPPAVSIAGAVSVTEGGTLEFPVVLDRPSAAAIQVDYTLGGTAAAGTDYTDAGSGSVTFAPQETRKTIALATVDDDTDGPEETVEVTLAAPDPALAVLGAPSTASGRIQDDEGLPEVTVAADAATVAEGADAVFTLTRANGDASEALTVTLAVTDAGAVLADAAADLPTEVTFEADAATAALSLATEDDAADEADTPVTLTLQAVQAGAGYSLGVPSTATVTVQDDDLPVVTVAAAAEAVTEGADAVFTLTRAGVLTAALEVTVEVADADAVLADAALPTGVTFAAEAATATLALVTADDEADEPDASVTLTLQAGAGYGLGDPSAATVTVEDDDRPLVTTADAGPVTEGEAIEFPVRLSGPFDEEIEVAWQFGGTAAAGDDYTPGRRRHPDLRAATDRADGPARDGGRRCR